MLCMIDFGHESLFIQENVRLFSRISRGYERIAFIFLWVKVVSLFGILDET